MPNDGVTPGGPSSLYICKEAKEITIEYNSRWYTSPTLITTLSLVGLDTNP
jgi:hypothetical protein